jgi:membrane-associated protein
MREFIEFVMHIDEYIIQVIANFGLWTYLIVFGVIFAETGFVVTPFLPGDSLLFVLGALAAKGSLNIFVWFFILCIAAVLGDATNYFIGHKIGRKAFRGKHFFKEEDLEKTEAFYEKHGGKTIIIARFVPIIRTFAPFVAGIGKMHYPKFFSYNVVGGIAWVTLFLFGGFFFGNIPAVKENFTLVIFAILLMSVLPAIYHWAQGKITKGKEA